MYLVVGRLKRTPSFEPSWNGFNSSALETVFLEEFPSHDRVFGRGTTTTLGLTIPSRLQGQTEGLMHIGAHW